jgi:hypothetical protein
MFMIVENQSANAFMYRVIIVGGEKKKKEKQ